MKGAGIYRWNVLDKHTRQIKGSFSTERGAKNGAAKLCADFNSPGRYIAVPR